MLDSDQRIGASFANECRPCQATVLDGIQPQPVAGTRKDVSSHRSVIAIFAEAGKRRTANANDDIQFRLSFVY